MTESEDKIEALNRAFGSRTGDTPRFTAESEGDDYLFGALMAKGERR
ncbi:hypothetical protein [Microbacterium dauci]|uniref:Uncharacterized protein n=1 Tax=Microbacterium dauci TaxID=3048008 RepID=A0ABT6ZBA0_9MICO|nr:hypothetical protein [Microbacterium sp. LX3-4]MDJ1113218.1 hypothetical protein [Microbacterium sp. LX3-4]